MILFLHSPFTAVVSHLVVASAQKFAQPADRETLGKLTTLGLSIWALFLGVYACLFFDKSTAGFQFPVEFTYLSQYNLALSFGVDGISMVFLLLTLFTFPFLFVAA